VEEVNPSAGNPFQILQPSKAAAKDPVCGMDVDPAHAAGTHIHRGETFYFCSGHCLARFRSDPERYLKPQAPLEPMPGGEYTCPMHPEVVQMGPGACPICGMALEPKTFSLEQAPNPELAAMSRRFWISLALTIPVFLLAMAEMIPGGVLAPLLGRGRSTGCNWCWRPPWCSGEASRFSSAPGRRFGGANPTCSL
jgi:YHS domain-containing protein